MIWSTLSILKQAHFEILPGFWGISSILRRPIILRTFHDLEYLHRVSWETWGIQGKLEYLEKGLCWQTSKIWGTCHEHWNLTIYNMPLMYMLAESSKVPKHWEVLKDRPFSYLETCKIFIRISWLVPYKICKILYVVPYWICKVLYKASSLQGLHTMYILSLIYWPYEMSWILKMVSTIRPFKQPREFGDVLDGTLQYNLLSFIYIYIYILILCKSTQILEGLKDPCSYLTWTHSS